MKYKYVIKLFLTDGRILRKAYKDEDEAAEAFNALEYNIENNEVIHFKMLLCVNPQNVVTYQLNLKKVRCFG